MPAIHQQDTPARRKARGAFFTPETITGFIAEWAVRTAEDRVLEPSAGDAAFLVAAVDRLHRLAPDTGPPPVDGVEIHPHSARLARQRVLAAGGEPRIREDDFFLVDPEPVYDTVIGNPPFIRYQEFAGEPRARSRRAALRAGVALTGLASSWAAFTVHAAQFLKPGGRLGLVLPAELLSVNYAAPVRRYLFDQFRTVELAVFDERVFPEVEADVVVLLADGYRHGPTDRAMIRRARNADDLPVLGPGEIWTPLDPAGKWTDSLVPPDAVDPVNSLLRHGRFTRLEAWGDTTLGIVTGNNQYFTLSPQRTREIGLPDDELLPLSPPGSSHLRGLALTDDQLDRLGRQGRATSLFYPSEVPSAAARAYIADGHTAQVHTAYKCRVRKLWYRVPIVPPADLLLTCMNADTPRLTTNEAGAHHLNSVHGVYLREPSRDLGLDLLPLASINSVTLLHAEMVGRAYGGGILKLEPKEADRWAVPSGTLLDTCAEQLRAVKQRVGDLLAAGRLLAAVDVVDDVMLVRPGELPATALDHIRSARAELARRRTVRASGAR